MSNNSNNDEFVSLEPLDTYEGEECYNNGELRIGEWTIHFSKDSKCSSCDKEFKEHVNEIYFKLDSLEILCCKCEPTHKEPILKVWVNFEKEEFILNWEIKLSTKHENSIKHCAICWWNFKDQPVYKLT